MALEWRETARSSDILRTDVNIEWFHPDGRVLRDDGATLIPDTLHLHKPTEEPDYEHTDEEIAQEAERKRERLEKALGVA